LGDVVAGVGRGSSKQVAEQLAAQAALAQTEALMQQF